MLRSGQDGSISFNEAQATKLAVSKFRRRRIDETHADLGPRYAQAGRAPCM